MRRPFRVLHAEAWAIPNLAQKTGRKSKVNSITKKDTPDPADSKLPEEALRQPIAILDAGCALCCWSAWMIHRLDRSGKIRICPQQSELGTNLMLQNGLDPANPVSWLLIVNGEAYEDLEAVVALGRTIGGLARATQILLILPKAFRRGLYGFIARHRYQVFGRGDLCALPDPAFQSRILHDL